MHSKYFRPEDFMRILNVPGIKEHIFLMLKIHLSPKVDGREGTFRERCEVCSTQGEKIIHIRVTVARYTVLPKTDCP